jgi:gamma-glutamyltranspeptidase/glutathione hydrolase
MSIQDLQQHHSLFPEAISVRFRDVRLWQVPPNGQGMAALIALAGLQALEEQGTCPPLNADTVGKTADSYHVLVEMMRLGFADARKYVTCPDHAPVPIDWLLDKNRIGDRVKAMFDANIATCHEPALPSSDTVSFQVVDTEGNAISFVNSNFKGFGTGLVPAGCGFSLQNRGFGFSLDQNHPNNVEGGKRPYHTIIPAMLTYAESGDLYATLSNMGGFMQPQGHIQLTVNMVAGGLDPQAAIDLPRFCIPQGTRDGTVHFESGIPEHVLQSLAARGHQMNSNVSGHARVIFGKAQIIKKDPLTGVLWAGSDGRGDGLAIGF